MSDPAELDGQVLLLDVETTGTDKGRDQIVELAIQFGFGTDDDPPVTKVWRFKPTVPIHPGAQRVHGISMAMLEHELPFVASSQAIATYLDAAEVLIGYNIRFDLDMLVAELTRARQPIPDLAVKTVVDPLRLWHQFEPRTLAAAHRRFVGAELENAHNAAADIAATGRVALAMLDAFGVYDKSWAEIGALCEPERKFWLGHTDHFKWVWHDGAPVVIVTFGKHKDTLLHECATNGSKGYLGWVQKHDFPPHVKHIAHRAMVTNGGQSFLAWAASVYPPPPASLPEAVE